MTESTIQKSPGPSDSMVLSAEQGRAAWRRLGYRLRAITPAQVMQFLLAAGALYAIGWLAWTARIALLPFVLGAVLAYIMLPLVNVLDRFLPRWLASLLTMGTVTAVIIYMLVQTTPLIARQIYNVAVAIPTEAEFETYADEAANRIATLPAPVQNMVRGWLESSAGAIREQIDSLANQGINLVINTLLGLFDAVGFVLGFLVIPTWLLTVLNEQKRGAAAINRMLPQYTKKDFWAIVRIMDRALSTFVRGQFFVGLIVGILTYFGLSIVVRLMNLGDSYNLVLAMFSGILALIPTLGPILGSIPVILLAWSISGETAVATTIMYVLIWLFVNNTVLPRVEERLIDIHPAIMVIIIVAVSELGFLWVLLAAPLAGIIRDLFRYVYGRFGNPPRPAGILPQDPLPRQPDTGPGKPVPIAYRRGRARRSAMTNR